jgi:hypothetical protein
MVLDKYIGGEYASHDLDKFILEDNQMLYDYFPESLNGKKRVFFETGTDALAYIISEKCKVQKDLHIWIPENYCMETIERLRSKLNIVDVKIVNVFKYNSTEQINSTIGILNCILLLHYNCFSNISKFNFGKDFFVVEDFVQAPFDIKKSRSDYAINSLRKFCNLEIAVAYVDTSAKVDKMSNSSYFEFKKKAELIKTAFFKSNNSAFEIEYLNLFKRANDELFTTTIQSANPSEIDRLTKMKFDEILKRRISNYNYLKAKLVSIEPIQIIKGEYMYFMIKCEKRNELKKFLANEKIFTAIHWLDANSNETENSLSIHIDHRYGFSDLDRIGNAISMFYAK